MSDGISDARREAREAEEEFERLRKDKRFDPSLEEALSFLSENLDLYISSRREVFVQDQPWSTPTQDRKVDFLESRRFHLINSLEEVLSKLRKKL